MGSKKGRGGIKRVRAHAVRVWRRKRLSSRSGVVEAAGSDNRREGLPAAPAPLGIERGRLADKDGSVAGPLLVVVERGAVQARRVVPDAQVALGPPVAHLGVVRLRLELEEVVEERAALVERDALDALGEALVDEERVEPRDGVRADDGVCRVKCLWSARCVPLRQWRELARLSRHIAQSSACWRGGRRPRGRGRRRDAREASNESSTLSGAPRGPKCRSNPCRRACSRNMAPEWRARRPESMARIGAESLSWCAYDE